MRRYIRNSEYRPLAVPGNNAPNRAALAVYSRVIDSIRRQPNATESFAQIITSEANPLLQRDLRHMTDRVAFAKELLGFEKEDHSEEYYAQEYLCQFIDRCSHMFDEEELREIFSQDAEPWDPPKSVINKCSSNLGHSSSLPARS